MKLILKTLKGEKFEVEVEDTNTVLEVKQIIERSKSELPAVSTKLIHSGKVLKDETAINACGIKPNDFLVVMVTKAKKPAAAPASAAPAATAVAGEEKKPATATTTDAGTTTASASAAATASSTTSATTSASPAAVTATPSSTDEFSAEVVSNLTSMGFPEAEVRHCLRAAHGNPDVAMEFLTNGIPEAVSRQMNTSSSRDAASSGTGQPLQALRNHPQFSALRRLVQSNPQMLQQVLTQIGQQQPELLQEINANQALFLQMMNEPVEESTSSSSSGTSSSSSAPSRGAGGMNAGMMDGMGSPAQMAQMIQSMSAEELNQMAQMMGLSPDQLRTTAQMIGQMPPEQLNQFMMQAMGGDGGGMGGMMGGGTQVLRLTEEEMAAVNRLAEMGFDRSEAAQAFLACDKNEALAANLLMDSMGEGGGAFGFGNDDGNDNNGNDHNDDDDDGDDMYD